MNRRESGQIMVLFGLAVVGLVALVALVLDGGNIYVQRRTAQTSADAAAMAGTHALELAPGSAATIAVATIAQGVCDFAQRNAFGPQPQVLGAYFVKTDGVTRTSSGSDIVTGPSQCPAPGSSSGYPYVTIPSDAAGVHVDVNIPFHTYLAGMLRIYNLAAQAPATAMVGNVGSFDGGSSPFIVCGINTALRSGGTQSVLLMNAGVPVTPPQLDPNAIGKEYVVHGPNPHDISQCDAGSEFKGLADQSDNASVTTLPADMVWTNGTSAGPTRTLVDGANGCVPPNNDNCVMILPIATGPGTSSDTLHAVLWAAFLISSHNSANYDYGVLLGNYALAGGSRSYGWTFSNSGPTVTVGLTQ
jgi:Putative Flp pilus-assembly TadE/G-like